MTAPETSYADRLEALTGSRPAVVTRQRLTIALVKATYDNGYTLTYSDLWDAERAV